MEVWRRVVIILSALQALLSFSFYKYGGLYFYFDEIADFYSVRKLVSQGSDEDAVFAIGGVLFLLLFLVNVFRLRHAVQLVDVVVLIAALVIQVLLLGFIEVGSFAASLDMNNGWILSGWLAVLGLLWLSIVWYLFGNGTLLRKKN